MLKYIISNSGIMVNVKLYSKIFNKPPKPKKSGQSFMLRMDIDSIGINNSLRKEPNSMYVIEI